jgi:hypothetical protein
MRARHPDRSDLGSGRRLRHRRVVRQGRSRWPVAREPSPVARLPPVRPIRLPRRSPGVAMVTPPIRWRRTGPGRPCETGRRCPSPKRSGMRLRRVSAANWQNSFQKTNASLCKSWLGLSGRWTTRSVFRLGYIDAYSLDSLPADDDLPNDPASVRFRSIAEILLRGILPCVAEDRDLDADPGELPRRTSLFRTILEAFLFFMRAA